MHYWHDTQGDIPSRKRTSDSDSLLDRRISFKASRLLNFVHVT